MSDFVDPQQFVITRRRKKYRFAKFANAANCFEYDEWQKPPVNVLEIGAGTGLFSVELAARHPRKQYVALDVKADRLQKGAYHAIESSVQNVSFVRARADQINELFAPGSLDEIWVTFPDPFPRKGNANRRLTHPRFLELYAGLLKPSTGKLMLKHDNAEYFHWSLEQLVESGWTISELSFDLHDSLLSGEYKIMTTYETRWISEQRITHFASAHRPRSRRPV